MLRALQFHVAVSLRDKGILAIAERLDVETTEQSLGGLYNLHRLLSLLAAILAFDVPLHPSYYCTSSDR